jgi:hypothetical protein
LQETATDILGLEFKELNFGLNFPRGKRPIKEKYIVLGPQASSGCKEWSKSNWIVLTKLLSQQGYKIINLTQDRYDIPNTINHYGQPTEFVINYLGKWIYYDWALYELHYDLEMRKSDDSIIPHDLHSKLSEFELFLFNELIGVKKTKYLENEVLYCDILTTIEPILNSVKNKLCSG